MVITANVNSELANKLYEGGWEGVLSRLGESEKADNLSIMDDTFGTPLTYVLVEEALAAAWNRELQACQWLFYKRLANRQKTANTEIHTFEQSREVNTEVKNSGERFTSILIFHHSVWETK